jgi:hypothetical protein
VAQQPQVRQHKVLGRVEAARGRIAQQRLHVGVQHLQLGSVKGVTWARKA